MVIGNIDRGMHHENIKYIIYTNLFIHSFIGRINPLMAKRIQ